MDAAQFAQPHILSQPVYVPGKPISHVAREFGLDASRIDKLASNENPLGPSPKALEAIRSALQDLNLYPDGSSWDLTGKVAQRLELDREQLVFGNGSNEVLELVAHAFLGPGTEAVMGIHGFAIYKLVTLLQGATPVEVPMPDFRNDLEAMKAAITPRTRVVFLASPNNPTGPANTQVELFAFARALPEHVLLVVDEAYAEYMDTPPDLRPLIREGRAILCTRTFSKIYGLAGIRAGYGYGRADIVSLLHRVREPFNLNSLAQAAAIAALDDHEFVQKSRRTNHAGMNELRQGCTELGLEIVPSDANFLMVRLPGDLTAAEVFPFLQSKGTIVRPVGGLPHHLRITIGLPDQNQRFLEHLSQYLALSLSETRHR